VVLSSAQGQVIKPRESKFRRDGVEKINLKNKRSKYKIGPVLKIVLNQGRAKNGYDYL
jgi:hypothetical protein